LNPHGHNAQRILSPIRLPIPSRSQKRDQELVIITDFNSIRVCTYQFQKLLELINIFTVNDFLVAHVRKESERLRRDAHSNQSNGFVSKHNVFVLNIIMIPQVTGFVNPPSVEVDTCNTVHIKIWTACIVSACTQQCFHFNCPNNSFNRE
jgi:hypothetical protein